jgi:LPS O-antigen subunit length determinant protein (WzzB/FepE family)
VDTRETLEALQRQESPQIVALQEDLAPLEAELQQRGLLSDVPLKAQRERHSTPDATALGLFDPLEDQDPGIAYAKTQLRYVYARYNGLEERLQAAQLELESARAAFKYRYMVIKPAQPPRGPVAPKTPLVLIASVLAGLVLGAFGPTLVDLSSRTFLEDWQVEQTLGVPLLGTLPDR